MVNAFFEPGDNREFPVHLKINHMIMMKTIVMTAMVIWSFFFCSSESSNSESPILK